MLNLRKFDDILKKLHDDSGEIEASAIISDDGIMLSAHLPMGVNEDHMSAMSAALLSLGGRMVEMLAGNKTDRVMIQSEVGYVIVSSVVKGVLLTVVARSDAKLGMVFHDIKKTAGEVQRILDRI